MNASQRRIFRRALSSSMGLNVGQCLERISDRGTRAVGKVVAVAPTGKREVHVKLKNNHVYAWPLKECTRPLMA